MAKQIIVIERAEAQAFQDAVNLELIKVNDNKASITYSMGDIYRCIIEYDADGLRTVNPDGTPRLHCCDCRHWSGQDGEMLAWCSVLGRNTRRDKKQTTCRHFSNVYEEE